MQRVEKVTFHEVETLPGSARAAGGFGSTGKVEQRRRFVMSLFRKKSEVPEEQALLAAMDDMRKRPKHEPGIEDVREPDDRPSRPR